MANKVLVMSFKHDEIATLPVSDNSRECAYLLVLDYDNKYVTNEFLEGFKRTFIFNINKHNFSDMSAAIILKVAYESIESGKILVITGSGDDLLLDVQSLIIQIFGISQRQPRNNMSIDVDINNHFYSAAMSVNLWELMTYGSWYA